MGPMYRLAAFVGARIREVSRSEDTTGSRHRRQATDETPSREVGFCVEYPTGAAVPYRKPDPALPKLGARLALTRRALDLTRFQMAQLLGTDMPTWGTYEDGLVRIPPDEALKLAPYGIPLNWIYEGKMANLPPHIRAKIREERDRDA